MIELLTTYPPMTILICTILLVLAFKEVVEFIRWFRQFAISIANKTVATDEIKEDMCNVSLQHNQELRRISENVAGIRQDVSNMKDDIQLLKDSDKDDIKAFITDKYHEFVERVGWIDDYTMEILERRYEHYQEEGGNSFIGTMMEQLRSLPRSPRQ